MFEYAKQQLQTSITPHLTTLNQTITTLRPHPTTSTSASNPTTSSSSSSNTANTLLSLSINSTPSSTGTTATTTATNTSTTTTPTTATALKSLSNMASLSSHAAALQSLASGNTSLSDLHPLISIHNPKSSSKKQTDSDHSRLHGLHSTTTDDSRASELPTAPEFSHIFFESELFKITLADAEHNTLDVHGSGGSIRSRFNSDGDFKKAEVGGVGGTSGPYVPVGSVFYIHKALLASLSPELRKHTDNQMKEGLLGEMILGEVDRATMQRFLQWAYRGEYTVTTPEGASATTDLLEHIKLYVFGDRFNIGPLQNLSFNHIIEILPTLQLRSQNHQDDMLLLLRAVRYSADNLPSTDDQLMTQLILTLAWALESISVLPEFAIVIHAQPEVAVAVCRSARGSIEPPWTQVEFKKPKPQLKLDINRYEVKPRKSKCGKTGCGFLGFPMLQCKRCKKCWQDARTGYPENDWKFATCRWCGEEETSASLFEICPVCKEGDSLKWF